MSDKPFSEEIHQEIKDFFSHVFLGDLNELHKKTSDDIRDLNNKYNQIVTDIETNYKEANKIKQSLLNAIDPLTNNDSSLFKQLKVVLDNTHAIKPAIDNIDTVVKSNLQQIAIKGDKSLSFAGYAVLILGILEQLKSEVDKNNEITKTALLNGEPEEVSIYKKVFEVRGRLDSLITQSNSINESLSSIKCVIHSALTNDNGEVSSLLSKFSLIENNLSTLTTDVGKINRYHDDTPIMPSGQLEKYLTDIVIKQNKLSNILTSTLFIQICIIVSIALVYIFS